MAIYVRGAVVKEKEPLGVAAPVRLIEKLS
jgi:hypothetical protein